MTISDLSRDVLKQAGWRARIHSKASNRVIGLCVQKFPDDLQALMKGLDSDCLAGLQAMTADRLTADAHDAYLEKYGSSIWITLILQFIVPVIVDIIVKWWFSMPSTHSHSIKAMRQELADAPGLLDM